MPRLFFSYRACMKCARSYRRRHGAGDMPASKSTLGHISAICRRTMKSCSTVFPSLRSFRATFLRRHDRSTACSALTARGMKCHAIIGGDIRRRMSIGTHSPTPTMPTPHADNDAMAAPQEKNTCHDIEAQVFADISGPTSRKRARARVRAVACERRNGR